MEQERLFPDFKDLITHALAKKGISVAEFSTHRYFASYWPYWDCVEGVHNCQQINAQKDLLIEEIKKEHQNKLDAKNNEI